MAIWRQRLDGGHYVRGFVPSAQGICTWQLAEAGVNQLQSAGLRVGMRLPVHLFSDLYNAGYLTTQQSGVSPTDPIDVQEIEDSPVRFDGLPLMDGIIEVQLGIGEVNCVRIAPEGRRLFAGSDDGVLYVFELDEHANIKGRSGHRVGNVDCLACDPRGDHVWTASEWGDVSRVDCNKDVAVRVLEDSDSVYCLDIDPSGERVAFATGKTVHLFDATTGKKEAQFRSAKDINALGFASKDRLLLGCKKKLHTYDPIKGLQLDTLIGHGSPIRQIRCLTPRIVVSACYSVRAWDLETGRQIAQIDVDDLEALCVIHSFFCYAAVADDCLTIGRVSEDTASIQLHASFGSLTSVSYSNDLGLLAMANRDGQVWFVPIGAAHGG